MAGLANVLASEPHWDDEIAELESRFSELHLKYRELCDKHRPHGNTVNFSRDAGRFLYAPEFPELLRSASRMREDRNAFIQKIAQPPDWPSPPPLLAERIRLEIESAGIERHDLESSRIRLYNFFTRRRDALRSQRDMMMDRLKRFVRDWGAMLHIGGMQQRLRIFQQDLEMCESRLRRLAPRTCPSAKSDRPVAKASTGEDLFLKNTPYEEGTLSCIFRGDIIVHLRETIFEDRTTRMLRRFLQRIQHLPYSHRKDIWRKTLQLKAAASDSVLGSPLPLLALCPDKLQVALTQFGNRLGIRESLRSDDGHTFVYSVGLEFPKIFEKQVADMLFMSYPENATEAFLNSTRSSWEQPSYWFEQGDSVAPRHETPESDRESVPSSIGHADSGGHKGPFWKSSEWVQCVLLRPNIDRYVVEQRALLQPSESPDHKDPSGHGLESQAAIARGSSGPRETSTTRKRHTNPQAHKQTAKKNEGRVGNRKHVEESAHSAFAQHETDIKLKSELIFLKEVNAKGAHKTLCERATKVAALTITLNTEDDIEGKATQNGSPELPEARNHLMPSEHMIQSYYLMRYIHSRELRCSLLHLLNLFRFAQRRVAHAVLAAQIGHLHTGSAEASVVEAQSRSQEPATLELSHRRLAAGSQHKASAHAAAAHSASTHSAPSLPMSEPSFPSSLQMDAWGALQILDKPERLVVKNGRTVVVDENGLEIIHDVAQADLTLIEAEIVEIGSHFINKAEAIFGKGLDEHTHDEGVDRGNSIDRAGVVYDLLQAEVGLHEAKWHLLEPYLEIFEHTIDPSARHDLAQRIVDVMAYRPHLDLDAAYFLEAYTMTTAAIQERSRLLRMTLDHQIRIERHILTEMEARCARINEDVFRNEEVAADEAEGRDNRDPQLHLPVGMSHAGEGLPSHGQVGLSASLVPTIKGESEAVDLFDFYTSTNLAWQIDLLIEDQHHYFTEAFETEVCYHGAIEWACAMAVSAEWQRELARQPVQLYCASTSSGDVFGCEGMDDPAWLTLLIEDAMTSLPSIFCGRRGAAEDVELRCAFSELSACPPDERVLVMYSSLLEHVTVRKMLTDTVLELRSLEKILAEHGSMVGADVSFHQDPLPEFDEFPAHSNKAPKKSSTLSFEIGQNAQSVVKPCLLAGDYDSEYAQIDLSKGRNIVLHCCEPYLSKLHVIYQHELANRWLYVVCVMHNVMVTDTLMKRQILQEVSQTCWRDFIRSESEWTILERLEIASSLSPNLLAIRKKQNSHRVVQQPVPTASDFQRLGSLCQFPSLPKSAVRLGISGFFRDRTRDLKNSLQIASDYGSRERILMRFKSRLLSHANLFIGEAACDLAVRIQAANTALQAQRLIALLPAEFSPFKLSTAERPLVFVDGNGTIGSIFHMPRALDLLGMRGTTQNPPDVIRKIVESDRQLPSVFELGSGLVLPKLELKYSGPSYVALELLRVLMPLVAQIFFWCSLAGDRHIVLRSHHAIASSDNEPGSAGRAAKLVLDGDMLERPEDYDPEVPSQPSQGTTLPDPPQKTWDAWENMRIDFMNLQGQLQSLKDNSAESTHRFLQERLRCAAWRTSLLLRRGISDFLGKGDIIAAAEVRRWAQYLDGYPVDGGSYLFVAEAERCHRPPIDSNPQMADIATFLKRLVLVRLPSSQSNLITAGINPQIVDTCSDLFEPMSKHSSDMHPFLHATLAIHSVGNSFVNQDSEDRHEKFAGAPLPFYGRALWQLPRLPLEALTRGLCFLQSGARQEVAEVHLQLEMKLESYFEFREVSADKAVSLEAEAELTRTLLTVSRLRDAVLCAQLRVAPPCTPSDIKALEEQEEKLYHAKETDDTEMHAEHNEDRMHIMAAAPMVLDAVIDPFKQSTEALVQDLSRLSIKKEMRSAYDTITRFIAELHKMLLNFGVVVMERQYESLRSKNPYYDNQASSTTGAAHPGSPGGHSHSLGGHGHAHTSVIDNARVQAVTAFNRIRLRGTQVRIHGQPIAQSTLAAYVIREHDLDECIEEVGRRVLQWASLALDGQSTHSQERLVASVMSLRKLEQHAKQQRWNLAVKNDLFHAQVVASVADRSNSQLFEIDRLHRVLNELAAAAFEMEYRLNAEIRHTVLEEIGQLEKQLAEAQQRKTKYLTDMRSNVQQEIYQLRQHIFHEMTSMSKANFVLRQKLESFQEEASKTPDAVVTTPRASAAHFTEPTKGLQPLKGLKGPVISESGLQVSQADIESLHDEINSLRKGNTRLQTFYQLKFQKMRQEFELQIQAFTTTLSSNSDLWERASEIKERELIAEEELGKSQRRVAAAGDTIERISSQVAKETETAARLESWKAHAFEWLDTLSKEDRKYQQEGGNIDVQMLIHQIAKLDAEIMQLDGGSFSDDRAFAEKKKVNNEVKHIKRQLGVEDKLTEKTHRKAGLIQREIECGELVDDESLVGLFCDEYRNLAQKLSEVEAKNGILRSQLEAIERGEARKHADSDELDPLSDDFEQHMCYSVGFMKCPQAPWYRSQIDAAREGRGSTQTIQTITSRRSVQSPRNLHWSSDLASNRQDILQKIRSDITTLDPKAPSKGRPSKPRPFSFDVKTRRDMPLETSLPPEPPAPKSAPKEKLKAKPRHTIHGMTGLVEPGALEGSMSAASSRRTSMAAVPASYQSVL